MADTPKPPARPGISRQQLPAQPYVTPPYRASGMQLGRTTADRVEVMRQEFEDPDFRASRRLIGTGIPLDRRGPVSRTPRGRSLKGRR